MNYRGHIRILVAEEERVSRSRLWTILVNHLGILPFNIVPKQDGSEILEEIQKKLI